MVSKLLRYNNWFSIVHDSRNRWKGLASVSNVRVGKHEFCAFTDCVWSFRAFRKLLQSYHNTDSSMQVIDFLHRYAPASENNVCNYLMYIEHYTRTPWKVDGCSLFEPLPPVSSCDSLGSILQDDSKFWSLAFAVSSYEMGCDTFKYYVVHCLAVLEDFSPAAVLSYFTKHDLPNIPTFCDLLFDMYYQDELFFL